MSEATIGVNDPAAGLRQTAESQAFQHLLRAITAKTAKVAVIGLGHVGLPTAVVFAGAGYQVTGVDIREDLIRAISAADIPLDEPELRPLLQAALNSGAMHLTSDGVPAVRGADVIIICVQTPVSGPALGDRAPDLRHLEAVCDLIGANLRPGALVVIESTVPPGTTEHVVAAHLQRRSGLNVGADFWLVHCPERMAPGNGLAEITGTARVVGGLDALSVKAAAELWRRVTTGEIVVTRAVDAEIAKLAENSFRAVNIAFANELALLCQRVGADVTEVIRLANSHPRVKILTPGPGPGGPCIPKDPDLLIHAAKGTGLQPRVLHAAQSTNASMPREVAALIRTALGYTAARNGRPNVFILGVAYKAGIASTYHSPAAPVIAELMQWGASVAVYDPYSRETFGAREAKTLEEGASGADCIVILTDHREFRALDFAHLATLLNEGAVVVDARRILDPAAVARAGLAYVGLGRGRAEPS